MWYSERFTQTLTALAATLVLTFSGQAQDLKTTFYQNYNHWKFQGETIHTFFEGGFDQWRFGDLEIRPRFRGQLDEWLVGEEVTLRTRYEKTYDRWEIHGKDYFLEIERNTFAGTRTFHIRGDFHGSFSMIFANDYERWNFDDLSELPEDIRAALVFLAIFSAVHPSK